MKKARTRSKAATRRQRATTALMLAPVLVFLLFIDSDDRTFWQNLLLGCAICAAWGLAVGVVMVIVHRMRTGTESTRARR